jgi:hypothetical protein
MSPELANLFRSWKGAAVKRFAVVAVLAMGMLECRLGSLLARSRGDS